MLQFIQDHLVVIGPAVIAVLDLLFALNPASKSNGLLHWLYQLVGGKS